MENKISLGSLSALMASSSDKGKKQCDDFLREFFRLISETLSKGESVKIKGFGTFKITEIESRESVNVNTGKPNKIDSYSKVTFTPSKDLALAINLPFREFSSIEIDDNMPEEMFEKDGIEEPKKEHSKEEDELIAAEKEEKISNENFVSLPRLEEGSDEEGEDDEITYEAYAQKIENNVTKQEKDITETNNEIHQLYDEKPENVYYGADEENKSRFGVGFLVGALSTFAVCIVIFILGCFFNWWPENLRNPKAVLAREEVVNQPLKEESEAVEIPEETPTYDTVSTTRYLTTIARDHYGDFNFWPYIYLENQEILGHPDRITPGTKVVVPPLSKYGVEVGNPSDIKTAKEKGLEIYSRFK